MPSKWSTNLFDCCNTQTAAACCCFPCTLLHTVQKEHQNKQLTCINCALLTLSFGSYLIDPVFGYLIYQINMISLTSSLRNDVRETDKIVSDQTCTDKCYDVTVTALCPALSLAQVMRQQNERSPPYVPMVQYKMERS